MIIIKLLIPSCFITVFLLFSSGCKQNTTEPSNSNPINYVTKPQHDVPWPSLAQTAWPKALHDAQNTGRSSFSGPVNGRLKETIAMGGFQTDPVMGPDSIFYIIADSNLCAFTLNGAKLWSSYIGTVNGNLINYTPPLITADGVILVGTYNGISAFSKDGIFLWKTQLNSAVRLKSSAIGLDGRIYTITSSGTLYAINKSGNIIWQQNAPTGIFMYGNSSSISFAPDGSRLYVGGSTAQQSLYVLNTNGKILRADSLGDQQNGALTLDVDGNIFSYFGNDLVSVSPTGDVRWRIAGAGANWNVVIDPNGNIAYLSKGYLVLVDNIGQERWRVPVNKDDYQTHLVCDAQGTIYIETSGGGGIYDVQAINNAGAVLWTLSLAAHSKEGGPSLTKEGYLLFPHVGIPPPKAMYVIN